MLVRGKCRLRTGGFTLVELLVVLLIFGILMAIAVPSLIASQPSRNLAAAGDRFAQDWNYARAKAESTKNRVFIAFETTLDETQVEGYFNPLGTLATTAPTRNGSAYIAPGNPGVGRTAKAYVIVEERPRYKRNLQSQVLAGPGVDSRGEPFTFLDWLNQYDDWLGGTAAYPVEPMFPYSQIDTAALGTGLDPKLGPFNAAAVPLLVFPQDIALLPGSTTYEDRHLKTVRPGGIDWAAANPNDQQFKVFCTEDQTSILAMDNGVLDSNGQRFYDPAVDNPRLQDQVIDYVLLKRVVLPEHCIFINPWKNSWVVNWEDTNADNTPDVYGRQDMQFLQYLWVFDPVKNGADISKEYFGGVKLGTWGYDPELQVGGTPYSGQSHGKVRVLDVSETLHFAGARHMWMVLEECVETGTAMAYPASAGNPANFGAITSVLGGTNAGNLEANKKVNLSSSGRMFTFTSLGNKYYVDDYTPNDVANEISPNDPNLNANFVVPASGGNMQIATPVRAREVGYIRNFLVPGVNP